MPVIPSNNVSNASIADSVILQIYAKYNTRSGVRVRCDMNRRHFESPTTIYVYTAYTTNKHRNAYNTPDLFVCNRFQRDFRY